MDKPLTTLSEHIRHLGEKPFKTIEQQVRRLEGRGVITDAHTPEILLREGYYPVVNGYGKVFLDEEASTKAKDDRYRRGTTFASMYQLFLFDRELRAITFRALMSVEGTLRSVVSHTFCEHHRANEAYLDQNCYTKARDYLRGTREWTDDLDWMINTLRRHAHGLSSDERWAFDESGPSGTTEDARIAWYRKNYEGVPLWVLFSDLTFGNVTYFFALMRRNEQEEVCRHMMETCGTTHDGDPLTPREMFLDLDALTDLRNACAHLDRVYDERYGNRKLSFPQMVDVMAAYLAQEDEERLGCDMNELVTRTMAQSKPLARVLAEAGFTAPAASE